MKRAGRVIGAVALAAIVAVLVWRRAGTPSGAAACPDGFAHDDARAERVLGLLFASRRARALAARAEEVRPTLCFGPAEVSLVTTERVLLLDAHMHDDETAARVAHLFTHVVDGPPLRVPRAPRDCDRAVARAIESEARALALELDVRLELRVTRPVLRIEPESAFRHAAPAARGALVLAWLRAHPLGGEGVDALGASYDVRCRAEAGRTASSR